MTVLRPALVILLALLAQGCLQKTTLKSNVTTTGAGALTISGAVSMEDFSTCFAAGSGVANCLKSRSVLPASWTQSGMDRCLTFNYPTALDSAMCLSSNGYTILHHRPPFQSDLEKCATAAGTGKIAACLLKKGLLPTTGLTQNDVDACVAIGGTVGLEKCLRTRGALPKKPAVFQSDLTLCDKVDGTGRIAECLINNDLVPATLTQANVDTCINAVGVGTAVKCMRNNRFVPNALMQTHINTCNLAVGQANIATCLDNNGLLEGGTQADITSCAGAVGVGSIAQCLRNRELIPNQLLQAHLNSCNTAVGQAGIFACLTANGLLSRSPGVTQAAIDTCVTTAGITGVVKCLSTQGLITNFPLQAHFNACNRYGGPANIATCLDASGALFAGLTQAQIDSCVTAVGIAGVNNCLNTRGNIRTNHSNLNGPGGIFRNVCSNCHGTAIQRGNMSVLDLNPANATSILNRVNTTTPANSLVIQRINSAANPMPPAGSGFTITNAERQQILDWITQGANP